MKIIRDPKILQRILQKERARGKSVGFVPTMGALHEGHLSLVRASNREKDVTVVSIFVNPTQFGPLEDFSKYPRVFDQDKKLLQNLRVDFLFCPSVRAMYPEGLKKKGTGYFFPKSSPPPFSKKAEWPRLAKGLCGKFRPGHFQGVVTIVSKLLDAVGFCRLYLGAKDYQQAAVIRQMVKDQRRDVQVRICPTVRERGGLALSSRNRYLTPEGRIRAKMISRILFELRQDILKYRAPLKTLKTNAVRRLKKNVDEVQYLEIVDPQTLRPLKKYQKKMVVLTACFVGKTRLIDNVIIHLS